VSTVSICASAAPWGILERQVADSRKIIERRATVDEDAHYAFAVAP